MMRLQKRLTLAFVLLAVLPLTAAGIVLTRADYVTAYQLKVAEQQQEARLAAGEVQAHINGLVRELLMAVNVNALSELTPNQQHREMAELLAWQNQFADLAWLDADGMEREHVALHEVYTAADLRSRADLDEFRAPRASGIPWFGPIEIAQDTAEPLMAVSVPAIDPRRGSVNGVLVGRIRLKRMWELVGQARIGDGDGDLIYIADAAGLVVAHPNPSVVLRGTRALLPEHDGISIGLDGNRVVAARVPLRAGAREFVVVAEEPLQSAMALPMDTALTALLTIAAALVAALALALLAGRSIVGPIQRLAAVAGQISLGDLTRRADEGSRDDEIGELATAFNRMTNRLMESVASLEARVTERTRDLTMARARLVEAIENISEGFVLCDQDDNVVLTNQRFRDFFPEIAHLAVPGRPFHQVIAASARLGLASDVNDDPELWLTRRQSLRINQIPHIQQLSSGRWLLVSERRTDSGQMVAIYTDITDLKAGEEELRTAKAQAESAAQAKGDFLAAMSHELRTPLNAVIGFSDTILNGVFGELGHERYREYVQDIHSSGLHLLSLINDILDLSKIEAGHMSVDRQPVILADVVGRAASMMRDSAAANGVTLHIGVPADLPPVVGDPRRLLQVVLNLMSNAVKFTPEGGRIEVCAKADRDTVELRVADSGIGIAPEDIPRALEVFGQIDSSRSRRTPGTGLGLPLSRRLVELLGGSLTLKSEPGVGTEVIVRLPTCEVRAIPAAVPEEAAVT